MNKIEKVFKMFASCIPVKGAKRSVICDLQRSKYQFIPNILFDILSTLKDQPISKIKAHFENKHDETIDEYFRFLIEQEFGFFCDNPESFPDLDLSWKFPGEISNAIVDIDANSQHNFLDIFEQLERLGCKGLQLRFFSPFSLKKIEETLLFLKETRIKSVEISIAYQAHFEEETLIEFFNQFPRLHLIILYGAPKEYFYHDDKNVFLYYTEDLITSETHCGQISRSHFRPNISVFTEAQLHNTCLNRKVSVDRNGYIRNCPSLKKDFGHIKEVSFAEALLDPTFKQMWSIHKDQIETCRDCEFRYICSDCRAYVESAENIYSKPLKCGYDPYTNTWEEWSSNPLKRAAMEVYENQAKEDNLSIINKKN